MSDIWRGSNKSAQGTDDMPKITVASARSSQTANSQPNILRTVYLPNEQVGQLKTSNEQLNL